MSLPASRGRRSGARPRATHLPRGQKVVVRASAVTTLLIGLASIAYLGYLASKAPAGAPPEFLGLFLPLAGILALLGVCLLVGGINQLLLRDDRKLALRALVIPAAFSVELLLRPPILLSRYGLAVVALLAAAALCAWASRILHTAHPATPAPPDPSQPERVD
jgi:hypothetical protein